MALRSIGPLMIGLGKDVPGAPDDAVVVDAEEVERACLCPPRSRQFAINGCEGAL